MGSLKDLMARDLTDVFLNVDDFAETVLFIANGGAGFAATLAIGDVTDQTVSLTDGIADQQQISATGRLSLLQAGINADITQDRAPQRGDKIQFSSGPHAGTWSVQTVAIDAGDGVVMGLRFEEYISVTARDIAGLR